MTILECAPRVRYDDGQVKIIPASSLQMTELPDGSVQCVVTSPPYHGLRKYSGDQETIWRGDGKCEHEWGFPLRAAKYNWEDKIQDGSWDNNQQKERALQHSHTCTLCGAWKGAYGLEPTPEMYVQHTIEFLREIGRVLRKDGVVFWNIGDSYNSAAGGYYACGEFDRPSRQEQRGQRQPLRSTMLKPKDLCLIPFRVAIAAQEDGWWVRSVVIWSKLNPMPESVTDRPTDSHEYILMLTKSARYYWDADAVREEYTEPLNRWGGDKTKPTDQTKDVNGLFSVHERDGRERPPNPTGRNIRTVWEFPTKPFGMEMCLSCKKVYESSQFHRLPDRAGGKKCRCADKVEDYIPAWLPTLIEGEVEALGEVIPITEEGQQCEYCGAIYTMADFSKLPQGRVKVCGCGESNWLSHFAVFPEALPEKCLLAATPPKCCAECGAPWERITQTTRSYQSGSGKAGNKPAGKWTDQDEAAGDLEDDIRAGPCVAVETLGWRPTCSCNANTKPSLVLDPFGGVGTTAKVAKRLGRHAVSYDISGQYCELAIHGVRQMAMALEV